MPPTPWLSGISDAATACGPYSSTTLLRRSAISSSASSHDICRHTGLPRSPTFFSGCKMRPSCERISFQRIAFEQIAGMSGFAGDTAMAAPLVAAVEFVASVVPGALSASASSISTASGQPPSQNTQVECLVVIRPPLPKTWESANLSKSERLVRVYSLSCGATRKLPTTP